MSARSYTIRKQSAFWNSATIFFGLLVDALVHGTRLGLYDLVARVSVCIAFIAWSLLQAEGGAWLV